MLLEIDQGNTRVKWRLWDQKDALAQGQVLNKELSKMRWWEQITALIGSGRVRVVFASVAKAEFVEPLVSRCEAEWGVTPERFNARPSQQVGELTLVNSYQDSSRMGVDRWLAMVAACHQWPGRALVIADAGSALNVELISPDGHHMGGYIAPGLNMMVESLLTDTGAITMESRQVSGVVSPGVNTMEAVGRGVLMMAVGLIDQAHKYAEQMWRADQVTLILSGGDGMVLAKHFSAAVLAPDIVLDGLHCTACMSGSEKQP